MAGLQRRILSQLLEPWIQNITETDVAVPKARQKFERRHDALGQG